MKTKLTMHPLGTHISPDEVKGKVFHHTVSDQQGHTVAWISHCAGDTTTWQIQLFKDGFPGKGTGGYETAEEAFAVLEKEFD